MFCDIDSIKQNIPQYIPTSNLNVGIIKKYYVEYC